MIETRKALNAFLKTLYPNENIHGENVQKLFFQQAPRDSIFPYVTYDFQMYPDGEGGEIITLDVDGWDSNTTDDTMPVELLMDTLKSLDKKTLTTDEIMVTFFLEKRIALLEDNKEIKHRQYSYTGNLFRRDY